MSSERWMPTTLGECADWISGSTPSKNRASYWDGSIPWISAKDMKQFRLYDSEDHVTNLAIQDGTRIAPEGSILVLVRGMTLHNDLPICICKEKMTFNQDVEALWPKPHVWGEYLAYWLLANKPFLRTLVDSASHGTGRIHTNILQGVELNLPSFDEQRAIARVLGALDDKIDLNRQMNETLEAMARALFKSWFVDFDPVRAKMEGRQPAGIDAETAALFPDDFVDSTKGPIPRGWRFGVLGDLAENPRRGVIPSGVEPQTPYIGLEHMPRGSIALADWGVSGDLESNKFCFLRGEILFGKLRPYFKKVGVAAVDGVCSTDIVVIVPRQKRNYGDVLGIVSSVEFINYTDAASTGTKMPRTSWEYMNKYEIFIIHPRLSQLYSDMIEPIVSMIGSKIHESRSLAALRDALLPKLLSGEILVNEAERLVEART